MTQAPDQLRGYQDVAVAFLKGRKAALLADDPGLGKTAPAIRAADELGADRLLILAPAIGRVSWAQQLAKWQRLDRPVVVLDKHSPLPEGRVAAIAGFDTINQKNDVALLKALRASRWDALVLDECHYLGNPASQRTRAVYGRHCDRKGGLAGSAETVWLLSGTPAGRHAGQLFPHINALFPEVLRAITPQSMDQGLFEDTFCRVKDGQYGRQIVGSKNLDRLKQALAPVMLRRRKREVLPELPPCQVVDELLDPLSLASGRMLLNADRQARGLSEGGFPDDLSTMSDDEFVAWLQANEGQVATVRRNLGLLKAPAAAAWAKVQLEGGVRKLILGAYHSAVIDTLINLLQEYRPVKIDGRDSHAQRKEAQDRFQHDDKCRVIVGQIVACSTSIDLYAASDIGVVEADWNPVNNAQFIARADRLGQKNAVLARFLSVPGTLDERISRVYRRLAEEMSALFD